MQSPRHRSPARAAFYDVDGTLIKTNIVHAFAWYAVHQPTVLGSLAQGLSTIASLPVFAVADKVSRKAFNALFYRYYKGQSEDRLVTLAEELFEDVIKPSIFPKAPGLVEQALRSGCRPVIVTGGLDFTVRPLARFLGVEEFIANRLEFEDGVATGKLGTPFVAGATKAVIIRDYAALHGIDLARSFAYTDSYSDYPMLTVVGNPAVVNPDLRLKAIAQSYDWPVLDLR
jgi:HAD superfamily hydrolase (TIGR01490 family)